MGEHAGPVAAPGGRVPARPGRMVAPGGPLAAPLVRLIAQPEQWRGHRGWRRVHRGWVRGRIVRVMADGTTNRTRHRIVTVRMVLVSAIVGVVLAVVSVPLGAVAGRVHQVWQSGWPPADWEGDIDRGDHVEFISRYEWVGETMLSTYMVPTPLDPAWDASLSRWIEPGDDPRPAFARMPYRGHESFVTQFTAGWPWRASTGRMMNQPGVSPVRMDSLVELNVRSNFVRIPLRPIWVGLLANTFFYGATVLALVAGLRWMRTRRRRVRGRCVACGYELGEGVGVCPECGLDAVPNA